MYQFSQKNLFNCLDLQQYPFDNEENELQEQKEGYWYKNSKKIKPVHQTQLQKAKIEQLVETNIGEDKLQSFSNRDILKRSSLEPQLYHSVQVKVRPFSEISCLTQVSNKREFIRRGFSNETQNIGKHLKSITLKFLNILSDAKILEPEQEISLKMFKQTNGSLSDFKQLFSKGGICEKCSQFYKSSDFISFTLGQSKMDFYSKLMMIKYIAKMRSLTYKQVKSWVIDIK